jgi:uncharacterized membrane protein
MTSLILLVGVVIFVLPIVAIFMALHQSTRITQLEKLIASMKSGKAASPVQTQRPDTKSATESMSPSTATATSPVPPGATQLPNISTDTAGKDLPPYTPAPRDEASAGKILGRLGIGAVLVGVAFFLKYAFENNWIGPSGRVMLGIVIGIALFAIGQYLRKKYLGYSDLLMGGGSAVLYLSIFSAYAFYGLISSTTAGVLMLCITALTLAVSIVDATVTLSLVGIIGAFATPFLVSTGHNDMYMFFFYLSIINLGVLGISFFKKWTYLNVASFAGTIINFIAWYASYYEPKFLVPTFIFTLVTFLIFLVANVARGISAGVKANQNDYFLMGANAFFFAFVGYTIFNPLHHAYLGFGAACVAVVYIAFAFMVNKANPSDRTLNIFLPGLAVTFLSIAVPLQFSGAWIAVAWLVESCILYFIASSISNRGFQVMGLIVYGLGIINYFSWSLQNEIVRCGDCILPVNSFVPIFNSHFMVLLLAVAVAYIIGYTYKRYGSITVDIQKRGIMFFVVVANILSVYALTTQVTLYRNYRLAHMSATYQQSIKDTQQYNSGNGVSDAQQNLSSAYYAEISKTTNQSNTLVSIIWTLYAAVLTAIGFARRIPSVRRLGLILFIITAFKVVVDVWSLGQLYRIISFIAFGIIALVASFAYAKYKDRLKEIV